jgi:hypothetical protein
VRASRFAALLVGTLALTPAIGGCKQGRSANGGCVRATDGSTVACVDGVPLSREQVSSFAEAPWWEPGSSTLPDARRAAVDKAVTTALFAAEAKRRGLTLAAGAPNAMASWSLALRADETKKKNLVRESIADDEAKKFYFAHLERFNQIDKVRARVVVFDDPKLGEQIYRDAAAGDDEAFKALVRKHSIDEPTRAKDGEREVIASGDEDHELLKMVLTLRKAGTIGGPFKLEAGHWCVVRVLDAPIENVKKLDPTLLLAVKSAMLDDRLREVLDALATELRKGAKIEIYDEAIDKITVPKPK